jgi:DNA-binding response OmpR family regulator
MAHVLLVDDDLILLRVLQFWLTDAGYTVTTHTAPAPALADVAGTAYDLLILDLMLPEIDGLQLCRQIRQTATTPILLLSAAPLAVYQAAARAAGADACVGKPVTPETLLAQVATLVAQGRSGGAGSAR